MAQRNGFYQPKPAADEKEEIQKLVSEKKRQLFDKTLMDYLYLEGLLEFGANRFASAAIWLKGYQSMLYTYKAVDGDQSERLLAICKDKTSSISAVPAKEPDTDKSKTAEKSAPAEPLTDPFKTFQIALRDRLYEKGKEEMEKANYGSSLSFFRCYQLMREKVGPRNLDNSDKRIAIVIDAIEHPVARLAPSPKN